jgi:hypothetical protein
MRYQGDVHIVMQICESVFSGTLCDKPGVTDTSAAQCCGPTANASGLTDVKKKNKCTIPYESIYG